MSSQTHQNDATQVEAAVNCPVNMYLHASYTHLSGLISTTMLWLWSAWATFSRNLKQAGNWSLGPFAAVLDLHQRLLQQQMQRNYQGLEIAMYSWRKL